MRNKYTEFVFNFQRICKKIFCLLSEIECNRVVARGLCFAENAETTGCLARLKGWWRCMNFIKKASIFFLTLPCFRYFFLFFGLAGNHPFRTRSFCWNNSRMLQNDENANTPANDDNNMFGNRTDAAIPPIPASRNIHQQPVPQ